MPVGGYYGGRGGCGDVRVLDMFMIFMVLEMCGCEEQDSAGLSCLDDRRWLMTVFAGWGWCGVSFEVLSV